MSDTQERIAEIDIAKHILSLIFPKANDADFKGFVERHGVHIAAIIRADRAVGAPAPAPTTWRPIEHEIWELCEYSVNSHVAASRILALFAKGDTP